MHHIRPQVRVQYLCRDNGTSKYLTTLQTERSILQRPKTCSIWFRTVPRLLRPFTRRMVSSKSRMSRLQTSPKASKAAICRLAPGMVKLYYDTSFSFTIESDINQESGRVCTNDEWRVSVGYLRNCIPCLAWNHRCRVVLRSLPLLQMRKSLASLISLWSKPSSSEPPITVSTTHSSPSKRRELQPLRSFLHP
jgi:hypothetical protein